MSKFNILATVGSFILLVLIIGLDLYYGQNEPQEPEQVCLQIPVEHGSAYLVLPKEEICENYCK